MLVLKCKTNIFYVVVESSIVAYAKDTNVSVVKVTRRHRDLSDMPCFRITVHRIWRKVLTTITAQAVPRPVATVYSVSVPRLP